MALRKRLVREIRRFRPEVVITGDPTVVWAGDEYINHPDHRAVAGATVDAIFPAAGQPNLFEELAAEGLSAHKVRKVYVLNWGDGEKGRVYVDISEVIALKIAALRRHVSQMGEWDPTPMVYEWAKSSAKGQAFDYAEQFRVVTLVNDEEWAKRVASAE